MRNTTITGRDLKLYEIRLTTKAGRAFAVSPDAYELVTQAGHDPDEDIEACIAQRAKGPAGRGGRAECKRLAEWFAAACLKRHQVPEEAVAVASHWEEYAAEIAAVAVASAIKKKPARAKAPKKQGEKP